MIKAKHHSVIYPLFQKLTLFLLKRNFNSLNIINQLSDNGKPVLIVANHVSWWDGFWIEYLNVNVFKRKFHFMMLEDQLKKNWYFKHTGGFSIKPKTRSVIDSLSYCNTLLLSPKNMVLMFPQGKINSMHNTKIKFEKGIEYIIKKKASDIQIVFVANLVDYLSNPKPNVYTYVEQANISSNTNKQQIEDTYNQFYRRAIDKQKTKIS